MKQNSRVLGLDIIRAIAIIMVILHHIPWQYISHAKWAEPIWFFQRGGWMGVDLFFVLSGFLVSGIYFREYQKKKTISVTNFLIRRGFKIYPNFYLMIFVMILLGYIFSVPISKSEIFSVVIFLQSYVQVNDYWFPTWSVAVEEHFYFLLSILFFIIYKFRKHKTTDNIFNKLPQYFIVLLTIVLSFRFWNYLHYENYNFLKQFGNTHIRIDSLMLGVVISYYYHFFPEKIIALKKYSWLIITVSALTIIPYAFILRIDNPWISVIGITHIYIVAGLVLISCLNLNIPNNIFTWIVGRIGANSYAIYLWHSVILFWLQYAFEPSIWLVITYIVSSLLIGELLTTYFENPILKLRDKLFPSTSGMFKTKNSA
jgi:peptidoglycan/LPS O-acetylase OafA/YrhL